MARISKLRRNEKGSLEINKAADMIVLDKDILEKNQKKYIEN